ncbi:MAG: hypothetical protein ACJ74J_21535 [Blastocatellia bacterium]
MSARLTRRVVIMIIVSSLTLSLTACDGSKTTVIEQAPQVTAANEIAAMARLSAIGRAEVAYQTETGGQYATLDELVERRMVNDPAQGKLTGYKFEIKITAHGFEATATPERYGISGKRSFYVDEQNAMRGADRNGAAATASDPQV